MLNPRLFKALTLLFGETPRVINEGSPAEIRYPPPIISFLPVSTPIASTDIMHGEEYSVNCPFCGDKRHRLTVSYMWNVKLQAGMQTYQCSDRLFRCFNEECQRVPENSKWFIENLNKLLADPVQLDAADMPVVDDNPDTSDLANQVPLPPHMADIMHPSVPEYVRHYWFDVRGYSPDTLAKWHVKIAYMPYSIQRGSPLMQQPVTIIPVIQHNDYWWFQARLIPINGDPRLGYERNALNDEYPKYYIPHGAKKAWTLYNLDNAMKHEEVAIVEGPTDVWRLGDRAMAKFGRAISIAQRGILERNFRGKSIILVPDQDDPKAWDEGLRDLTILRNTGSFKKVSIARLPEGIDPGDMKGSEDEVWQQLKGYIVSPDTTLNSVSGV